MKSGPQLEKNIDSLISRKKLHPIKQTRDDLRKNILKRDKVIIDAIKNGIVLHGHEKIIGMIKNVTSKE